MKYASRKLVFANDPNNENLDKAAEKIVDVTSRFNNDESCIYNIKEEKDLVFIPIEPITKQIQVFHHLTQIGGSIANLNTMMVAISGFTSDYLAIHVEDDIFSHGDEVKLPAWGAYKTLSTAQAVQNTKASNNGSTEKFRCIMAIPPLRNPTLWPAKTVP